MYPVPVLYNLTYIHLENTNYIQAFILLLRSMINGWKQEIVRPFQLLSTGVVISAIALVLDEGLSPFLHC